MVIIKNIFVQRLIYYFKCHVICEIHFPQASSYEFMVQNSDYQESYWYAFDYKAEQKSLFNLLFLQPAKKAGVLDHGV